MSQPIDVSNILRDLKALNDTNVIDVYLPSLSRSVKVKKLNIKQQKSLVMVALDDAISQLNFSIALYDIIHENVANIDSKLLNVFDRNSIVFSLLEDTASETGDLPKKSLSEIVQRYKSTVKFNLQVVTVPHAKVYIEVPTLDTDYRYNKTLHTKYNKGAENKKQFVEDVYIIELCKYINRIEFDNGTVVNLLDYPLASMIEIVESLPSMGDIIKFIGAIKDKENELNKVNGTVVNIEPSLFI